MREDENLDYEHYLSGELFLTWADFLLGLPGTPVAQGGNGSGISNMFGSLDIVGSMTRDYRDWTWWTYAQDDVKLTPHLTVNLGFRLDHIGDFGESQGRNSGFDPSLANPNPPASGTLAGITLPNNYAGAVPPGAVKLDNDFGINGVGQNTLNPRVGLAYVLPGTGDKVVLRGGYGVFHSRVTGQPFIQLITAPPFGLIREYVPNVTFSEQQPLPLSSPTFPVFFPYSPSTVNSITFFEPDYRPPIVQEFSLGTQTRITPSMVLEIGYSGARGLHLFDERDINQAGLASLSAPIRGQTTNTLANIQERVPFEGFSSASMMQIESAASSWYNALLVSLNKRFSHGLQFQVSYTWSKDMATAYGITTGANGGGIVGDQNNLRGDYGPDYFVRPHRLVINYQYQLPKPHWESAFAQQTLGGWSVQGVTTFQTGHFLTVLYSNGTSVYGNATDRAELSGECTAGQYVNSGSITSKLNDYINSKCFTTPPVVGADGIATAYGNSGVGILQGPNELNFDFSLFKNFPLHMISDSTQLQFRAEFFNIFNHPSFADPDTALGPGFGEITNTFGNPRIIQFALKFFF
jgi:hypothetical protein